MKKILLMAALAIAGSALVCVAQAAPAPHKGNHSKHHHRHHHHHHHHHHHGK